MPNIPNRAIQGPAEHLAEFLAFNRAIRQNCGHVRERNS